MKPDVAFDQLGPFDQYHEVFRLLSPWDEVHAWWSDRKNRNTWYGAVENWWYGGPDGPYWKFVEDLVFNPGIDRRAALHHVYHVVGSSLKREWKIGGAAMLLQEWCEAPDFERYAQAQRARWEAARANREMVP